MTSLEKLNKYTYRIDGDLTEFTPWHLSGFKAVIAIELNAPCSEDCLFDALELSVKLMGASETQVQFGSTVIHKNLDDWVMLMEQYELMGYHWKSSNRWYFGRHIDELKFTHSHECKHIAIAECIAALPEHLLDI